MHGCPSESSCGARDSLRGDDAAIISWCVLFVDDFLTNRKSLISNHWFSGKKFYLQFGHFQENCGRSICSAGQKHNGYSEHNPEIHASVIGLDFSGLSVPTCCKCRPMFENERLSLFFLNRHQEDEIYAPLCHWRFSLKNAWKELRKIPLSFLSCRLNEQSVLAAADNDASVPFRYLLKNAKTFLPHVSETVPSVNKGRISRELEADGRELDTSLTRHVWRVSIRVRIAVKLIGMHRRLWYLSARDLLRSFLPVPTKLYVSVLPLCGSDVPWQNCRKSQLKRRLVNLYHWVMLLKKRNLQQTTLMSGSSWIRQLSNKP